MRTRRTANTAGRRAGQVLLAGLVAALALLVSPATAQAAGTVTPTASCYQPNSDGTVSVLLGYVNNTNVTQTIPRGPSNVITPSRYDGAQPTTFAPGSHPGAFAVTAPASDAWGGSWTLDGVTLSNASAVNQCPAGTSLPADGNGYGMTMVLLAAGAVAGVALWRSHRRDKRTALPA
ncbi:hypothetical protein [Modestobacter sp. SSW1-42]|uniref:hypothetical protein n=1 Tax=Modestobacter sp. SSW1-42 TaxID=596372 RepID=UPI0039866406